MLQIRLPALALAAALAAVPMLATGTMPATAETSAAPIERLLLMSVDGRIVIEPDGSVGSHVLATELKPEIAALLGKAIQGWRFEPVLIDGVPRRVEARMRVSLAAVEQGKDYKVRVDNVVFPPSKDGAATDRAPVIAMRARSMRPPAYPS